MTYIFDQPFLPTDTCLVCGKSALETQLRWAGHGAGDPVCAGKCDPRYNEPRRRSYAELTPEVLDQLEWAADDDQNMLGVEVDPAVLQSLIWLARKFVK